MKKNEPQGNELSFILLVLVRTLIYKLSHFVLYWFEKLKWYAFSGVLTFLIFLAYLFIYRYKEKKNKEKDKDFLIGFHKNKKVSISESQRTTHTQVIGTTGSGKTESVVLPFILQDLKKGHGLLIIDGKSDNDFLEKLYSHAVKFNREKDFKLFSLPNKEESHSFNPLKGSSSIEIAEKVFSSFHFENEYYRNIQYKIFLNLISLVKEKTTPTFKLIYKLLTDSEELSSWLEVCENEKTKNILTAFLALSEKER